MLHSSPLLSFSPSFCHLNEQVKRNVDRFPGDFMFRLTKRECDSLMSQFATSKIGRGGRRNIP
ncbi:ORF6N domain-containing protein, partial [bacterium]